MSDIELAGLSLAGLVIYVAVGIAVTAVSVVLHYRGDQHAWEEAGEIHRSTHPLEAPPSTIHEFWEGHMGWAGFGAFWPLWLVAVGPVTALVIGLGVPAGLVAGVVWLWREGTKIAIGKMGAT